MSHHKRIKNDNKTYSSWEIRSRNYQIFWLVDSYSIFVGRVYTYVSYIIGNTSLVLKIEHNALSDQAPNKTEAVEWPARSLELTQPDHFVENMISVENSVYKYKYNYHLSTSWKIKFQNK